MELGPGITVEEFDPVGPCQAAAMLPSGAARESEITHTLRCQVRNLHFYHSFI